MKSLNLPVCESEARRNPGQSNAEKGINCLFRSWQWFKNQLIQDVPEDFAVCEFDCRKPHCTIGYEEKCAVYLSDLKRKASSGSIPRMAGSSRKSPFIDDGSN